MRGQAAFEYFLIVIIVMMFITPLWINLEFTKGETYDQMKISYVRNALSKIVESADLVYSQRLGAKVKTRISIPANVDEVNITGDTVSISIMTSNGLVTMRETSIATLNGTIPSHEGMFTILLEAMEDYVQIGLV